MKRFMNIKLPLTTVFAFTLTACAQTPPTVSPSVSLLQVTKNIPKKSVPVEVAEALNKGVEQVQMESGLTLKIDRRYFSALGQECAVVRVEDERYHANEVVCNQQSVWYLVPSIDKSRTKKELLFGDHAEEKMEIK